jgi:two-component system CheB/CheR fusion protein
MAKESESFPIVAIGASAGGMEALEQFFTDMPADTGLAFVLVQHLDPTHKSMLVELVKRYLPMKVSEVRDGMTIKPNCAYIIPPNWNMAILHGTLQLIKPTVPRGLRLPIDFFFRSLAEDQQERAICVVLSGTGTDGTLGLKAVKEHGGIAMVQTPESAKYDGMPRSAITTGLVDFVLPPDKMLGQLIPFVQKALAPRVKKTVKPIEKQASDLQKIFILLRHRTGHDFSSYKPNTLLRRIERRIAVNQIERTDLYVRYLQSNPSEIDTLFKELLIGVSNFFRDREAFEMLAQKAIAPLLKAKPPEQSLRVWVPGCATGEEAYSIAILLREHMDELNQEWPVQIFATDIDSVAIETARSAQYPESIAVDVSEPRLGRFFTRRDNLYEVNKVIRDMLVFSEQSLIKDPPFSRLDLVSCRNLLIYMEANLQKRILQLFHYALNQGGYLFLGHSETLGECTELFDVVDRQSKLFRCKGKEVARDMGVMVPILPLSPDIRNTRPEFGLTPFKTSNARELTEQLLLEQYAPAGVLINGKADALYFHGRTGKFLEPPAGDANWNIVGLARDGLRLNLATAIRKVATHNETVSYDRVRVKTNGEDQLVKLIVRPVAEQTGRSGLMLVMFEELASPQPVGSEESAEFSGETPAQVRELERELRSTREYLQTTVEELETANEELTSTNEELQSSNEELQSTNEELETSKEELQSVNEELVTVNSEHEVKLVELAQANDDMMNLLASLDIGTIYLDLTLCIKRFTPSATALFNLIQSDVGRPLADISSQLVGAHVLKRVKEVMSTLIPMEKEVQTKQGRTFLMRIKPYRTAERAIEGAILVFIDITDQKRMNRLATVVNDSSDAITLIDFDGRITAWNRGAQAMYGWSEAEALTKDIQDMVPADQHEQVSALLRSLAESKVVEPFETQRVTKDGTLLDVWCTVTVLKDDAGKRIAISTIERDITARRRIEHNLDRTKQALQILHQWSELLAGALDEKQLLRGLCHAFVEVTGYRLAWWSWVAQGDGPLVAPVAQAGLAADPTEATGYPGLDAPQKGGPVETAVRTAKPAAMRYIHTDTAFMSWRSQAARLGYAALLALPVLDEDKPLGVLTVCAADPHAFEASEIEVLETLGQNLVCVVQAFRAKRAATQATPP